MDLLEIRRVKSEISGIEKFRVWTSAIDETRETLMKPGNIKNEGECFHKEKA